MSSKFGISRHMSVCENELASVAAAVGSVSAAHRNSLSQEHSNSLSESSSKNVRVFRRRQTSLGLRVPATAAAVCDEVVETADDNAADRAESPLHFDLEGWLDDGDLMRCADEQSPASSARAAGAAAASCSVHLTTDHKRLVATTWPLLKRYMTSACIDDVTNPGTCSTTSTIGGATRIFLRIFELSPGIKRVFGFDVDSSAEEVLADGRLREHARRFTDAIGSAADNLDCLETRVAQAFVNLGRRHIEFRNIEESHFDVFCGAFMYVCREALLGHMTPDVSAAWRRLFDFLLQQLKSGYRLQSSSGLQWHQ